MLVQNERQSFVERLEVVERSVSSGGGGSAGLEVRVAKLEADVEHIKGDVGELRADMRDVRDRLTRIETQVDHLPSKGFVVTSVIVTLAVLTSVITFQDRIQRLVRDASTAGASSPASAAAP